MTMTLTQIEAHLSEARATLAVEKASGNYRNAAALQRAYADVRFYERLVAVANGEPEAITYARWLDWRGMQPLSAVYTEAYYDWRLWAQAEGLPFSW